MTTKVQGSQGIEFPDSTQQATAAASGPVFFARKLNATTLTSGSSKEVPYETEESDSNNCYNPVNGRFTPNVPGWYAFAASINVRATTSQNSGGIQIRKNGTETLGIALIAATLTAADGLSISTSALAYFNGTTDYASVFAYVGGSGTLSATASATTSFSGSFVRKA